jgi:hypothetical protein
VRRDPRALTERSEDEDRRVPARAWGIVLGLWIALFTFLAFVVAPLAFSLCEAGR